MTLDTTPRHALPLLAAGQAQKEIAHNEALTILDFMTNPIVESAGGNTPPPSPVTGRAWIVGTSPTGDWAGRANQIACQTEGGWRFAAPYAGLRVRRQDQGIDCLFDGAGWNSSAAIAAPSGGAVVDAEGRAATATILTALRLHGIISS